MAPGGEGQVHRAKGAGRKGRPGWSGRASSVGADVHGSRAPFPVSRMGWSLPSPSRGVRREDGEAVLTTVPLTGLGGSGGRCLCEALGDGWCG